MASTSTNLKYWPFFTSNIRSSCIHYYEFEILKKGRSTVSFSVDGEHYEISPASYSLCFCCFHAWL